MKTGWLGIVAALGLAAGGALAQAPQAPGSSEVVRLDHTRYEGRYYEIARFPTFQQRNCAADTVMTFLKRVDGDVSVVYQCFAEDRSWIVDIGLLDVSHGDAYPGELYVRPDLIGWSPWQWGTYRLIEAPEDFRYVVIGDAARSRLWILSRTRQLDEATYNRLVARAAERGYDTQRLVRGVQNGL
ncbi:MAG: lipocalin family protein [Burkholderiales bacterium]